MGEEAISQARRAGFDQGFVQFPALLPQTLDEVDARPAGQDRQRRNERAGILFDRKNAVSRILKNPPAERVELC